MCAQVKEFLDEHGVQYESVNLAADRERWVAAGSPPAPSLAVDGVSHAVSHPRHAARLLGIEADSRHDANRLAADLMRVLDAWLECLATTPWPLLLKPTESRGRTPRELTVNVFKGVELLPGAWKIGEWHGALERGKAWAAEERAVESTLTDRLKLLAYARGIHAAVGGFLRDSADELELAGAVTLQTAGGELAYTDLLEGQRMHAGQHLRQVTTFLGGAGAPVPALALEAIRDLPLPNRIY